MNLGGPVTVNTQPQSQSVVEGTAASFSIGVGGTPPFSYQWLRNGVAIPGATNPAYTIDQSRLSDNGVQFRVAVSNVIDGTVYSVLSSNAVLSVLADTNGPVFLSASGISRQSWTILDGVRVEFDEAQSAVTPGQAAVFYAGDVVLGGGWIEGE